MAKTNINLLGGDTLVETTPVQETASVQSDLWLDVACSDAFNKACNFFDKASFIVLLAISLIAAFFIIRFLMRTVFEFWMSRKLVYIRVTLPRSDSKLDKEKETKKDFKEKAGIMSVVYKSVHKMSATSFKHTLYDLIFDHIKVSFEMVYDKGEVFFYLVTYEDFAELITQQVTSIYSDAEVKLMDKSKYINFKRPGYHARTASFAKDYDKFFPIKTYKYFEEDPLSIFTNNFGKLAKDDMAVYQIVAKPMGEKWNKEAKKIARRYAKGEYKRKGSDAGPIARFIIGIFKIPLYPIKLIASLFTGDGLDGSTHPGAGSGDAFKIFNQAEQEAQKMVGESAGQQTFVTSITAIVASKSSQEAENGLNNLILASSTFTDEYCNKLDNPQVLEDIFRFIYSRVHILIFRYKLIGFFTQKSYFSVDEMTTMYHFPDANYNRTPIINWLEYKKISPPRDLKTPKVPLLMSDYERDTDGNIVAKDGTRLLSDKNKNLKKSPNKGFYQLDGTEVMVHQDGDARGESLDAGKMPKVSEQQRHFGGFPVYKDAVLMGWNEYRNKKTPIYFDNKDRGRHHYVLGKSGGGKSVFIGYLARQDIWAGRGVGVVDPHGDLVEDILAFTPKDRAKDMVVFDPADYERPMGLNMLEVYSQDPDVRAIEKDRAAMDATSIFIKIFNEEIFGPRIQHYFRNGALTLMDDDDEGGTLIDVPRLFTDNAFMKYKASKVKNPVVRSFWEHEYANTGDRERQEMIPYFSAKFGPFITNTTIRNIIGQPKSAFNIREIMDNEKCLMVNLSKGKIGDLNAQLLGLILVSKVNMAAMSRADMPEEDRKDFFFYVDEFQNFATDTFGEILSEARKYKLALIMAHQYIAQIGGAKGGGDKPSIKDAVFGNCGTIMSFKVGADDAEYLEKEYAPVLSQQDIIGIANYTTYCKLNIDNTSSRAFDIKTVWDNDYKNVRAGQIIKEYSRRMYARKKEYVDMEIEARIGINNG